MIPHERDELDVLAGEYVLGTLDEPDAAEVDRALAENETLRAAVEYWQTRLHPLTALAAPAEPNPATWRAIEARIASGLARRGAWHSTAVWRGIAAAAIAVAACLALYVGVAPVAPSPSYVALLRPPHATAAAWVAVVGKAGLVLRATADNKPAAGRSYELWAIARGGTNPEPLGVIASDGTLSLHAVPAAVSGGATLAISIEPAGGSPTGKPTGPVVFTGQIEQTL
jgi:anti-sigma-K factor RskA